MIIHSGKGDTHFWGKNKNAHPISVAHSICQACKMFKWVYAWGVCVCAVMCVYSVLAMLTAQILQDEVQLSPSLEGIDEVHNERVLHLLQNVPLCFGVSCVLCITHNHGLAGDRTARSKSGCEAVQNNFDPIS